VRGGRIRAPKSFWIWCIKVDGDETRHSWSEQCHRCVIRFVWSCQKHMQMTAPIDAEFHDDVEAPVESDRGLPAACASTLCIYSLYRWQVQAQICSATYALVRQRSRYQRVHTTHHIVRWCKDSQENLRGRRVIALLIGHSYLIHRLKSHSHIHE